MISSNTVLGVEGECFGCGDDNASSLKIEFSQEDPGLASFFTPRPEHRGAPGYVHGGVVSTALDETMAALCWVLDDIHVVTAKLEIKFRAPVPLDGRRLRLEAWREGAGRRRQRVHSSLRLPEGQLAATASGIFIQVPDGPQAWRPF